MYRSAPEEAPPIEVRTTHYSNVSAWQSEHAIAFTFLTEGSARVLLRRHVAALVVASVVVAIAATALYFTGDLPRWRHDESPFERFLLTAVLAYVALAAGVFLVTLPVRLWGRTRLVITEATWTLCKHIGSLRISRRSGSTATDIIATDTFTQTWYRRTLDRRKEKAGTRSDHRLAIQDRTTHAVKATFGEGISRTARMLIRTTFSRMTNGKPLEWPNPHRPWRHVPPPSWFPRPS